MLAHTDAPRGRRKRYVPSPFLSAFHESEEGKSECRRAGDGRGIRGGARKGGQN